MESIKELKKICQPSLAEETWYVRNLPRRLSIYLTRVLLSTKINANQITAVMFVVVIATGIFLGLGEYVDRLVGVACLQLFILLDCVDGEIARYKKQVSAKGAYLDLVINDVSHISIFMGLSIGLFRNPDLISNIIPSTIIMVLGISAVIFQLLDQRSIACLTEAGVKSSDFAKPLLRDKKLKLLKSWLLFLIEPIHVINIVTIAAMLNILSLVLIGYGIFFPLWWIVSVATKFRKI